MPWHIESDNSECSSGYAVVVDATGEVVGCHDTRQEALDHLAALNANVSYGLEGAPMEKRIALFEVKAVEGEDPNGEFEGILSVPTIDRDGEVIDAHAFDPLPGELPIHKFHDFSSPVATATPYYEGDILKARGVFDPDPESQAIRAKLGRSIRYMSVGFMGAVRSDREGVPHITQAELLEASFVSVPSNREAAILAVKELSEHVAVETKAGRVLSAKNESAIRQATKLLTDVLEQLAAASEDDAPAVADPEKAAAPAAAKSPADANAGLASSAVLARLLVTAAEAELLLLG